MAQKFIEISKQVHDIENGYLPKEHHEHALRDLGMIIFTTVMSREKF